MEYIERNHSPYTDHTLGEGKAYIVGSWGCNRRAATQ